MKFLVIVLTSLISTYSLAQEKQNLFKPFTVIIIKPDTARIADSLKVYADTLEKRHRDGHFALIRNLEKNNLYGTDEMKEDINLQIQKIKSRENEIYKFKYYHTIAERTLFELKKLFNPIYWESNYPSQVNILEGDIIDPSDLATHNLEILRTHYKVDYTITFEDVHTDRRNGILVLKYVLTLFSKKENKVILKKEIEGNAPVQNYKLLKEIFPSGGNQHEFRIDCENYLDCMIKSAVRFSTEELFNAISVRQKL